MQNRTRAGALIALLLVALIATAIPASAASPTDEQDFVARINQERAKAGLNPLAVCDGITSVARAWSDKRAAASDHITHNPDYSKQIPSGWTKAAENVAWGSGSSANVATLHTALMNSAGHRANILGDFTHVGVGVTLKGSGSSLEMYVTQNFGKYPNGCAGSSPPPPPPPSSSITLTIKPGTYDSGTKSKAALSWTGASGGNIDVLRAGTKIKTTANDGGWTDKLAVKMAPGSTQTYQVCQAGTTTCSPVTTVTF